MISWGASILLLLTWGSIGLAQEWPKSIIWKQLYGNITDQTNHPEDNIISTTLRSSTTQKNYAVDKDSTTTDKSVRNYVSSTKQLPQPSWQAKRSASTFSYNNRENVYTARRKMEEERRQRYQPHYLRMRNNVKKRRRKPLRSFQASSYVEDDSPWLVFHRESRGQYPMLQTKQQATDVDDFLATNIINSYFDHDDDHLKLSKHEERLKIFYNNNPALAPTFRNTDEEMKKRQRMKKHFRYFKLRKT